MEELGYHKATLSSILAVVICGTGSAQTPLFHTSLQLSATAQSTFRCVLICGHDMTYTFCLCLFMFASNKCSAKASTQSDCCVSALQYVLKTHNMLLQSAHMVTDDVHLPSEPPLCPGIMCLAFPMQHQKDYETWGDMKATRGSVSEKRKAT